MHPARPTFLLALCRCALLAMGLTFAQATWADSDHDQARRALQSGQVRPLSDILQIVGKEHPGQVLEIELEQERERWFYDVKLLTPTGTLRRLRVDATTGRISARNH